MLNVAWFRKTLLASLLIASSPGVKADAVVLGSVNQSGGVWTYNYTLDNTTGSAPVWELGVLIAPDNTFAPGAFTSPPGWSFGAAHAGSISSSPYNECCTFALWSSGLTPVPVGSSLTGFSFTVDAPPSDFSPNNYFVFGDAGIAAFGTTVVPLYHPLPEPSTWAMLILGFAGLGFLSYRRSRKNFASIRTGC